MKMKFSIINVFGMTQIYYLNLGCGDENEQHCYQMEKKKIHAMNLLENALAKKVIKL
jgi:hypothetical protein